MIRDSSLSRGREMASVESRSGAGAEGARRPGYLHDVLVSGQPLLCLSLPASPRRSTTGYPKAAVESSRRPDRSSPRSSTRWRWRRVRGARNALDTGRPAAHRRRGAAGGKVDRTRPQDRPRPASGCRRPTRRDRLTRAIGSPWVVKRWRDGRRCGGHRAPPRPRLVPGPPPPDTARLQAQDVRRLQPGDRAAQRPHQPSWISSWSASRRPVLRGKFAREVRA